MGNPHIRIDKLIEELSKANLMPEFLVTGVAGFIGSNLAQALIERGYTVRGLDNFSTGRRVNIEDVENSESFELVEGDLRNQATVENAVEGVKYVLHQGAVPSVPRSIKDPRLITEVNCLGTTNLLIAARNADVEKFVSASSSSVYGPGKELPKHEEMAVNPVSPYALSKFWTERLTLQFSEFYDFDTLALRYFNVFGPRQDPTSEYAAVIPKFISDMLANKQPTIYGDGEQTRDFTFIENVTQANLLASQSETSGIVINIACNERVSINSLADKINNYLGTNIIPIYDDPREGDVRHSLADIERARDILGYEPKVGFDEGLKRTIKYLQKNEGS
jgi:nucleoside-diphosphate-sugar epimerase